MRSVQRIGGLMRDGGLARDVGAIVVADGIIGASFGAISVAAGVPVPITIGMSLIVFAGGSQFLAVGIAAAGGGVITAVLAGLLLNARHLPFGLAIGEVYDRSWPTRLIGSHLLIDESVAFALARTDPADRRRAYWCCGIGLFITWNLGTVAGAMAGAAIGEPEVYGLDAAFPAGLLALLLPSLRERSALLVSLVGAGLAVATTPFLPPGLPVLVALLALALAAPVPRRLRNTRDGSTHMGGVRS
jgi:4-azaleucine resistance transporter AzlC